MCRTRVTNNRNQILQCPQISCLSSSSKPPCSVCLLIPFLLHLNPLVHNLLPHLFNGRLGKRIISAVVFIRWRCRSRATVVAMVSYRRRRRRRRMMKVMMMDGVSVVAIHRWNGMNGRRSGDGGGGCVLYRRTKKRPTVTERKTGQNRDQKRVLVEANIFCV